MLSRWSVVRDLRHPLPRGMMTIIIGQVLDISTASRYCCLQINVLTYYSDPQMHNSMDNGSTGHDKAWTALQGTAVIYPKQFGIEQNRMTLLLLHIFLHNKICIAVPRMCMYLVIAAVISPFSQPCSRAQQNFCNDFNLMGEFRRRTLEIYHLIVSPRATIPLNPADAATDRIGGGVLGQ